MVWTTRTVALIAVLALAGCGGRATRLPQVERPLDGLLNCSQIVSERAFIEKRIEDLDDERNTNTARTASRIPGAIIGTPVTAIILADPSIAIYREIEAWKARDAGLAARYDEMECEAKLAEDAEADAEENGVVDPNRVE